MSKDLVRAGHRALGQGARVGGRRQFLQATVAVGAAAAFPVARAAAETMGTGWREAAEAYLRGLARKDGGYGWDDQPRSHLTPAFATIGGLTILGIAIDQPAKLAEFVRMYHPAALKGKLEQEHREFTYQQVQSLLWLGQDAAGFRDLVRGWTRPLAYLKQYEQHGYPVFQQEVSAIVCRRLLNVPLHELSPEFIEYVDLRRRPNGSFNNTPASDQSTGHVLNTWWGLQALDALGRAAEHKTETIAWLQACQLPGGGFTHAPHPELAGWDDVAYTWAAVRSLALLGSNPADRKGCVSYLTTLRNPDGGFGDRPGWASNPLATYYALDALAALGALDESLSSSSPVAARRPPLPADLQVFSIQLEAHGKGSPADAVRLASSLKIHLWGAKNAEAQWIARAQALAEALKVPVRFFASNEEYGTWVSVPGMGTYSHTSDIVAPEANIAVSSLANAGVVTWEDYRHRRLDPLHVARGRLIWQFGENEPLVRLLLDDSLARGGFAAISTFHFGNPDFTNSEPFLKRYRLQLPFVALQDAHGNEPWWFSDMTTGFRTLFLAVEPTWEGWLAALANNWVAAIRHDKVSGHETWMHGGPPEVLDFVHQHADQWQWWHGAEIARPLVSLAALAPADTFEAGHPERGISLRVRTAWTNTAQGLPKEPLAELVSLRVDEAIVKPERVTRRRTGGAVDDDYELWQTATLAPGKHRAIATVCVLATGKAASQTIDFEV